MAVDAARRRGPAARLACIGIAPFDELRPVRFALASSLPALAVLSVAATARNIYLAPALPASRCCSVGGRVKFYPGRRSVGCLRAMRGTAALLLLACWRLPQP